MPDEEYLSLNTGSSANVH